MIDLKRKYELARKLLSDPCLEQFLEAGFIDDLAVRNCRIIEEYGKLREEHNHLDSVDFLAQKYFLSPERILSILYR